MPQGWTMTLDHLSRCTVCGPLGDTLTPLLSRVGDDELPFVELGGLKQLMVDRAILDEQQSSGLIDGLGEGEFFDDGRPISSAWLENQDVARGTTRHQFYGTVLRDDVCVLVSARVDGCFRMWFMAAYADGGAAYAESLDGYHWTRKQSGTSLPMVVPWMHEGCVSKDEHEADASRRYCCSWVLCRQMDIY